MKIEGQVSYDALREAGLPELEISRACIPIYPHERAQLTFVSGEPRIVWMHVAGIANPPSGGCLLAAEGYYEGGACIMPRAIELKNLSGYRTLDFD